MAESSIVGKGKVGEIKEKKGTEVVNRFILKRMMDLEDKETGGDDFLFWNEANAIDSAHRIISLDEKVCELYRESGKFAVERCIVCHGLPESDADEDALLVAIGVFTEESRLLHQEYAKSIAELFIKKMRLGALVDKRDKRATLMLEIKMAWKIAKEFGDKYLAFKNSLPAMKQPQDSYDAHAIVQDNAIVQENAIVRGVTKAAGFEMGSFRVLVEMMRGVKQPVKGLDDAMSLANKWCDVVIKKCVKKVWTGTIVERRCVFEVLKSEIAENWKMEKQVKDMIFDYQRELALKPRHVEESEGGAVVEGDLTKAGRYAAVGMNMIAAFSELAIVKAKRMCLTAKLKVD